MSFGRVAFVGKNGRKEAKGVKLADLGGKECDGSEET